ADSGASANPNRLLRRAHWRGRPPAPGDGITREVRGCRIRAPRRGVRRAPIPPIAADCRPLCAANFADSFPAAASARPARRPTRDACSPAARSFARWITNPGAHAIVRVDRSWRRHVTTTTTAAQRLSMSTNTLLRLAIGRYLRPTAKLVAQRDGCAI